MPLQNAKFVGISLCALLLSATSSTNAFAVDTVWKVVSGDSGNFTVHVVSSASLGSGFPNRALAFAMDGTSLSDIYVTNNTTGQAVPRPMADMIVYLLQSSFKYPANTGAGLSPYDSLASADVSTVSAGYPLLTSSYFSSSFVSTFIRSGAEGLDDIDDRRETYRDLIFDLAFQPDLYKSANSDQMSVQFVDLLNTLDSWESELESGAGAIEAAAEGQVFALSNLRGGVLQLTMFPGRLVDLRRSSPVSPRALDRLGTALSIASPALFIGGHAAQVLMLQAIGNERAQMRLDVLRDFIGRAGAAGGLDPALEQGFAEAESAIETYLDDCYGNLHHVLEAAAAEWPDGVIRTAPLLNQLIKWVFGKPLFEIPARVALPWAINYGVFMAIRDQADLGRTASLAATLHRKLYDSSGLLYHRDRIHQSPTKGLIDAQAFLTLQQMTYYLAQRHYHDTLEVLNNRISWIWGSGIDLFYGGIYSAQMQLLSADLERRRATASRISPPSYLATTPDVYSGGPQQNEGAWIGRVIRSQITPTPTPPPTPLLGVCVTLPFDSGGQPASLEDVNIRFEPRACSDIDGSQPWECGLNDPDGECTARVQLFWDNDTNQSNSNCITRSSGPCPIVGAEALSPKRGIFNWQPMMDSIARGSHRILARITDNRLTSYDYSDGYFVFVDPIFESGAWTVNGVATTEAGLSDGDGIPELGEEIGITLRLQNTSGRSLSAARIHRLRLGGESARQQLIDDFDSSSLADQAQNFILDDTVTLPNAPPGAIVNATDDFNAWIGTASPTTVEMFAWVEYSDPSNPVTPQYRRLVEIAFTVSVSDGGSGADLACDQVRLVDDTDHDGTFESGEKGYFLTTICNDGSWVANEVRGIFTDPPALGSWVDNDAGFGPIGDGDCVEAADDFTLDLENSQCGAIPLALAIQWSGGNSSIDNHCAISATCVPRQSVQDDVQAGTVIQGQTLVASANITNTGAATLSVSGVVVQGAPTDTQVTSFPASLAPGQTGSIVVSINSATIPFGAQQRLLFTNTNADNTDEHQIAVLFTVSTGAIAEQVTLTGVPVGAFDISGDWTVFARGSDIFAANIRTKEERRLTNTPELEGAPRIDGNRVVFHRTNAAGDLATSDIFMHDLSTGLESRLSDAAGSQRSADIFGDTVIWISGGTACVEADAYRYVIGVSAINGQLYHDPGVNRAVQQVRIDRLFAVFRTISWTDPVACSTKADLAFRDRISGSAYTLGLEAGTVCSNVSDPAVYENGLAFGCRCSGACGGDGDYKIRYYDLAQRTGSIQLTCDATFSTKKESPTFLGSSVAYHIGNSGLRDVYKVSTSAPCGTEIPLHTGSNDSSNPAGDPRAGTYAFDDNRTGTYEIWAVVPPPAVDAALSSFYLDSAEVYQENSYTYHVQAANFGSQTLSNLGVQVREGAAVIGTSTIPSLAAGTSTSLSGTWSTVGAATGSHSLEARIFPAPVGDSSGANNSQQVSVEVLDEDLSPPIVSGQHANPTAPNDGDAYIEAGEGIRVRWQANDPSGISSTHARVGGTSYPGNSEGGTQYGANIPNPGIGLIEVEVLATDGDDSPMTTPVGTALQVTVYPSSPTVIGQVPPPGAMNVSPTTFIDATFDADLDPTSISSSTVGLTGPDGEVSVGMSYDGFSRRVRLTPFNTLTNGAHEVRLEGGTLGIRDVRLNPLPATVTWLFSVTAAVSIFGDGFESGDLLAWSSP